MIRCGIRRCRRRRSRRWRRHQCGGWSRIKSLVRRKRGYRRGKQGFISPIEQKLILRLMSYFGLAPKGYTLTTDRFRKLMESYNKLNFPIQYAQMPEIGLVPFTYVKYEDWKNKINWFDPNLKLRPIEKGDCIYFSPKSHI